MLKEQRRTRLHLRLDSLTQRKFQQIERVRGSKTEMKAFSISFYIMCQFSSLINSRSADKGLKFMLLNSVSNYYLPFVSNDANSCKWTV
jgi:hypothetical protein